MWQQTVRQEMKPPWIRDSHWRVWPRTRQGGLGSPPGEVVFALGLERCAGILLVKKVEGIP